MRSSPLTASIFSNNTRADRIFWRVWRKPVSECPGFIEEDHNDFQRKYSGPLSLTINFADFEDGGSVGTTESLSALHSAVSIGLALPSGQLSCSKSKHE